MKPDNVILTPSGRVVLVDFGAARQFVAQKTGTYDRVATPGYAPLEQYGSHVRRGPYTDLYGLAATLYALIVGTPPPSAIDRVYDPSLPELKGSSRVVEAIKKAMNTKPAERPQTADEFTVLLIQPPVPPLPIPQPSPPDPTSSTPTPLSRPAIPKPVALVGLLLVLGVGGYGIWMGFNLPTTTAPVVAAPGSSPAYAPQILGVSFQGCATNSRSIQTPELVAGEPSTCVLDVNYASNGASLTKALFTYTLIYTDNNGNNQRFFAPGTDRWESTGGNVTVSFFPDMMRFVLPVSVRERTDRRYHTVEIAGSLAFDNGSQQTLTATLGITSRSSLAGSSGSGGTSTNSTAVGGGTPVGQAPKFLRWYFSGCESAQGQTATLAAGQPSSCDLVIDYEDIGTQPTRAVFSYTLKYVDAAGKAQEIKLSETDVWTSTGGNVAFTNDGNSYIFRLPISVRNRPDQSYNQIEVVGSIFFRNGGKKNVLEPLIIASSSAGLTDKGLEDFADSYLALGEQDDVSRALGIYASRVNYYSKGMVDRVAIQNDKSAYFSRWPKRSYQRVSPVTTLTSAGSKRTVRFDYTFSVDNGSRTISGSAYVILGVELRGNRLFIVEERGDVTHRN